MEADERQRQILARARTDGRVEVSSLADDLEVAPGDRAPRPARARRPRHAAAGARRRLPRRERRLREQRLTHREHVDWSRRSAGSPTRAADRLAGAETVYIDEGVTPQLVAEASRDGDGSRSARSPSSPRRCSPPARLAEDAQRHRAPPRRPGARRTMAHRRPLGDRGCSRSWSSTWPSSAPTASPASTASPRPTPPWRPSRRRSWRAARRRIFVGVHTKFGVSSFCRFADLPDFEALVTDTGVSAAEAHRFCAMGPHVIRA